MTERYALADLNQRRWDDDAPIEGDRENIADAIGLLARVRFAWGAFISVFLFSELESRTGLIRRDPWAKASRGLKAIEDMARGLLLMMALALPAPPKRSPVAPKPKPKAAPQAPHEPAKHPQTSLSVVTWLAASTNRRSKGAPAAGARRRRLANRWHRMRGLVCRSEALLRILNDPAPFARRVARRLDGLNRPLALPEYTPPPPRLLRRNEQLQEMKPGNPYRFILAPLWAHCADLVAARESPG
ncbi:MAG: hypothetical protein ABI740_04495 [Alphaproteobacteria bacterium]